MKVNNFKKASPAKPARPAGGLQRSGGFTLIESLVAISIFSLAAVTLMISLGQGLSDTGYVKKKMTAEYLAQEGIEYVRNMRDTYALYTSPSSAGWNNFNSNLTDASACQGANGCFFNADNLNFNDNTQPIIDVPLTACSSSSCPNGALLFNPNTGKYGFSGSPSGFTRKITITQPGANETKVFSTVSWTQGSGTRSVTFSENLFNWIE